MCIKQFYKFEGDSRYVTLCMLQYLCQSVYVTVSISQCVCFSKYIAVCMLQEVCHYVNVTVSM